MKKQSITKQNAKTNNMDFVERAPAASDTECTGVMFKGMDKIEREELNEVYPYEP